LKIRLGGLREGYIPLFLGKSAQTIERKRLGRNRFARVRKKSTEVLENKGASIPFIPAVRMVCQHISQEPFAAGPNP
jgi:hypothetical protein